MCEIFGVIAIVTVVLAILSAIGHGIWLLVAMIIRAGSGTSSRDAAAPKKRCPFCGTSNPAGAGRCQWCGRLIEGERSEELADLAALRRQLLRLQRAGVLDLPVVQDLLARVEEYQDRLLHHRVTQTAETPAPKPSLAIAPEQRLATEGTPIPSGTAPANAAASAPQPAIEVAVAAEVVEQPSLAPKLEPRPKPVVLPVAQPQATAAVRSEAAEPTAVRHEAAPKTVVPTFTAPARPVAAPAPPPPPKKPWMEVVAEFLEERNIRLAEVILVLVGGLLIVGGSVAVVISFWEQLRDFPYLKFSVFVAVHAAVFGLGLITFHRWSLEITGRGLLLIATLLVPLNFLAMASMSGPGASWLTPTALAELLAIAVFVYLVGLASRVLVPGPKWLEVLGVVGNSVAVLLIARLAGKGDPAWSVPVLGLLPVAICGTAVVGYVASLAANRRLDGRQAEGLFSLLGTAIFALAVALGLLVARNSEAQSLRITLRYAAPLLALAAIPMLSAGLCVMRRTGRAAELAAHRTAGTAVALAAIGAMVGAMVLAWPSPAGMIAVGVFDAAALAYVAFRHRIPIAHAGAIAATAVVYLLAFHLAAGNLAWTAADDSGRALLQTIAGARSGTALVGLFAALALISEWLARAGRRRHALQFVGGSAVVGLLSLFLVTIHNLRTGGASPTDAAVVYGIYGACSLAMAARWRKVLFTYLGLGLVVGATLWILWRMNGGVEPLWGATLAAEALVFGILCAAIRFTKPAGTFESHTGSSPLIEVYRLPLLHAAEALAIPAFVLAGWTALRATDTPAPIVAAASLALLGFLTAWAYRSSERTWLALAIVFAGLAHTFVVNYPGLVVRPWVFSLLVHATIAMLAGGLLRWVVGPMLPVGHRNDADKVFCEPFGLAAFFTSALAIPLLIASPGEPGLLAVYLAWLGVIWLVAAWSGQRPVLLAGAQAVFTAAVIAATTAWLLGHPWDAATAAFAAAHNAVDTTDPRTLQAYGVGLALLTLAWLAVRLVLRENTQSRRMLNPGWPSVDWVVGHALVVGQLLLVAGHALSESVQELVAAAPRIGTHELAFGPAAWTLWSILAVALLAALWNRWGTAEVAGGLMAIVTAACLIAGQFTSEIAVASASRWSLAIAMVVCVAIVCLRARIAAVGRVIGARLESGRASLPASHAVTLVATALPVVGLTVVAALLQMAGVPRGGPTNASLFNLEPMFSYLVPMLLVLAGLVSFALRETSAGYAFSGGLVAKLIVVLGFALAVITRGGAMKTAETAMAIQLATITAAVWAIAWLAARRVVNVWREGTWSGRVLMNLQLALGVLGNAVLLVPALLALVLDEDRRHAWTVAVGSPWGWTALVLVIAAILYRLSQSGRRLRPGAAGLIGMAALGFLACTVQGMLPDAPQWGYRTLMLGWAMYSVFIVAATWWVATVRTLPGAEGPPQALIRAAAGWVVGAGLLAVLLGLKAAFFHAPYEDLLWAAAAIALAAAACATMAVWRRGEVWALAAAPGVNVAASLVVWYWQWYTRDDLRFHDWWAILVEANVIASAAVALVWLAARRRLYRLREFTIRTSPLLALQTSLGVIGMTVLLAPVVAVAVLDPSRLPAWTADLAGPAGWAALVIAAAAAAWYLRQVAPRDLVHVVTGLGLGAGVLASCLTARWTAGLAPTDWFGFHVLETAWAAVALGVLGLGMLLRNLRVTLQQDPLATSEDRQPVFPSELVQGWVTVIGVVVLGLALIYSGTDPSGPWWSVRAIAALSLAAGLIAMWLRRPAYVVVSGLLINVAGTAIWIAYSPWNGYTLAMANVLCFAAAAVVWSLVRPLHPAGVPDFQAGGRRQPFAHFAAIAGIALAGLVTVFFLACDAQQFGHPPVDRLGWIAIAAMAVALVVLMWDRSARFVLPGLYFVGLTALGLSWSARCETPLQLAWTAAVELAVFALGVAILQRVLPRLGLVWRSLRISTDSDRWSSDWLPNIQVAGVAAGLSIWISIAPAFDAVAHPNAIWLAGRIGGPLAAVILLVVAALSAGCVSARLRTAWQHGSLLLGLLVLSETGWALLNPDLPLPWLHRSVILMVAAIAMTLVAGFGVTRLFQGSDWGEAGRRSVPTLAGLAFVMLATVLGQEGYQIAANHAVPMALPAVIVVGVALAALAAGCIAFALSPRLDPFGLSDRGRTVYVYVAEVLIALVCVHIRFTRPELFQLGIFRNYWMLLAMAVAFVGAALSELFHRRRLPVLSEPLERTAVLLPLAPALGFWFVPQAADAWPLAGSTPMVWFLAAVFYGFLAFTKRGAWQSGMFTLLSLAAANVGVGVMWYQQDAEFFWAHPQVWLIPVGLSILLAEYLNHRWLTPSQSAGIRYVALSVIYIPSSAEYLRAIGESVWLPLVLILLSMAGVLVGIVLRVRSFLYLGVTFLSLVLVTMIRYAAVDLGRTWILYLCCILLGAVTIGVVALYEKRREAIHAAVKQFKQWQR